MARIMKRKSAMTSRKVYKRKARTAPKKRMNVAKVVNKILTRKLETKQSNLATSTYQQIEHNNFITLDSTLLKTTQGTADQMSADTANRIGDEITLKGISLKIMLELNERYSDTTFRVIVVRAARGDIPTAANLFAGLSTNKMMDSFNKERYTIVASKYVKLTAPNLGVGYSATQSGTGTGVYYSSSAPTISRTTRIVRMYLPGAKFGRNGLIKYENGGQNQKFYDYHVLCYGYSNYSTSDALGYNVGACSTYMKQMYYTDA